MTIELELADVRLRGLLTSITEKNDILWKYLQKYNLGVLEGRMKAILKDNLQTFTIDEAMDLYNKLVIKKYKLEWSRFELMCLDELQFYINEFSLHGVYYDS